MCLCGKNVIIRIAELVTGSEFWNQGLSPEN